MTLMQRVKKIISALLMILGAVLVLYLGENGFLLIALFLCVSLVFYGLRSLLFYATMARHMVDGRISLYKGLILLDLGIFSLTVLNDPHVFIVLYILGINAFSGIVDILRALEARKLQSPSWRMNLAAGIVSIFFALAAGVSGLVMKDMEVTTIIFVIGVFWSAAAKLISAFRRTAIVYIP